MLQLLAALAAFAAQALAQNNNQPVGQRSTDPVLGSYSIPSQVLGYGKYPCTVLGADGNVYPSGSLCTAAPRPVDADPRFPYTVQSTCDGKLVHFAGLRILYSIRLDYAQRSVFLRRSEAAVRCRAGLG